MINPHHLPGIIDSTSYEFALKICIKWLLTCDGIYMLDGWEDSRGAKIEYAIAEAIGMKVMHDGLEEFGGSLP